MDTFWIRAVQLIFSLSILIFVHELGHFFFARLFKVRVEKFYMFFNPNYSIVRAKKVNGKWQVKWFSPNVEERVRVVLQPNGEPVLNKKGKPLVEPLTEAEIEALPDSDWRKYPETTEWGLGWLPLGGYCKIAGMIDETTAANALSNEPQKWEYRAQKAWKRMLIIVGGVLMNLVTAMVLYSAMLFTWGEEFLPMKNARYGLQYTETMQQIGFQNGDQILSVDHVYLETKGDVIEKLIVDNAQTVQVMRNTDMIDITIPENFSQRVLAAGETSLFDYRFPSVITDIMADSPAAKALLMAGDSIVAINGVPTPAFQDVQALLKSSANETILLSFFRAGALNEAEVTLSSNAQLGVTFLANPSAFFEIERREYGFFEAIPMGIRHGWSTLTSYVKQFKLVFTKEGSKQLGGFGSIGKMFPTQWNWQLFWSITALLSVILAFMNILPIPALDGGHVVFLIYEMVTRRKPSEKFMENTTTVGFILLFALLIYVNLNDIIKALF